MNRADELTLKLLDESLTNQEWEELEALLCVEPVAHAHHLQLLELEGQLRGLRTDFDLAEATVEKIREEQIERTTTAVMAEIATLPRAGWSAPARRSKQRLVGLTSGFLAIAAALLIGIWIGGSSSEPRVTPDSPIFARLTSMSGSVELRTPTGEVTSGVSGTVIPPGYTLRTVGDDSLAIVEFPDQATVEIEPGTVVRFPSNPDATAGPRIFLALGQLTAVLPDQSHQSRKLTVSTASTDVTTRGGRFVVTSAGPDSARVEPMVGSVQIARAEARGPVLVGVGGAAFVSPGLDWVSVQSSMRVTSLPRRKLPLSGVRDVAYSPDGKQIWLSSGRLLTWWTTDGGTGESNFLPRKGGDGVAAIFSPDRTAFATFRGEKDDNLSIRDLPLGDERVAIPTRVTDTRFLAVAPRAAWVASVEPKPNNRRYHIWDGNTGAERFTSEVEESIACVCASPDGMSLAIGVSDSGKGTQNKVVFIDPSTGSRTFALPTQRKGITTLEFSPDGRFIAVGFNGAIQIWDTRSRELVRTITGFERVVYSLAYSPDGRRLAAGTHDGQIWVWRANSGKPTQRMDVGGRGVRALAFSPNGLSIVSVASSAPVAIWDITPDAPDESDNDL